MKRAISLTAATIAGGLLALGAAQGLLAATTCQFIGTYTVPHCPNTVPLEDVLGILGATAGFWLVYTGRLARLFRRVP